MTTYKQKIKKLKRKKPVEPFIINGEVFSIIGLKRKMELEGLNPKEYRKHPDYLEMIKQMQDRRRQNLIAKKEAKANGLIPPEVPLTNHPYAYNQHKVESEEEQDKKLQHKIKKTAMEILDSMDIIKKIAKAKIPKTIKDKLRTKRAVSELDLEDFDLSNLDQITKIISNASRAQLVAIKTLDVDNKKKLKTNLKQSISHKNIKNKLEGEDSFFNFKEIEEEVSISDDLNDKLSTNLETKEDVLKSLEKLFN